MLWSSAELKMPLLRCVCVPHLPLTVQGAAGHQARGNGNSVVERKKQIEIENQEIVRREKELEASVKLPAEAARFKVETLAEGERYGGCFQHFALVASFSCIA